VNTNAIALPHQRITWDRIRGLYNGFGYVLALSLIQNLWWSLEGVLPALLSGRVHEAGQNFSTAVWMTVISMIPGPTLVPVLVNLAPRAGPGRLAYLFLAVIPMGAWCLYVGEGVRLGWDLPSIGHALEAVVTTSLVVGVCAYHSYSRETADSLLRTQITSTTLAAEMQRAQLRLLRAQIEPHFLFNSLSVVRALARNDRAGTVSLLDNLIRYFEAALPKLSDSEVPLAQELELVDAYLAIYRARMGTRLDYEIVVPEDLAERRVPSMMLLTLVENALKHGVSPAVAGGVIRVSAAREHRSLRLVVADSGRGIDLRHGRGAGLANVRQRLLMMYGPAATLSLRPAEPQGVVASIVLPVGEPV
jgi:two-component sensor histidine kinase